MNGDLRRTDFGVDLRAVATDGAGKKSAIPVRIRRQPFMDCQGTNGSGYRVLLDDLTARLPHDVRNWEHTVEVEVIEAAIALARGDAQTARQKLEAAQRISDLRLTGPYPTSVDYKDQRARIDAELAKLRSHANCP
jgi:hypothetical protein